MKIRLQRFLAQAGLGSRRSCEELIKAGRVSVGGEAAELGATVDPELDTVAVDGRTVAAEAREYWLLNKPVGVLSAVKDDRGRQTITDCVPTEGRVFPVGRLDLNSTGVILVTNDGLLTERLLHPRYHVDKEYVVKTRGRVSEAELATLRRGVEVDGTLTAPAMVRLLEGPNPSNRFTTTIGVVIHEGRKRQVRRMFESVGHKVTALHRARFATLTDRGLALGQARRLSDREVAELRKLAGLS